MPLAGASGPVRTLVLPSLAPSDGRALLQDRGLRGEDAAWAALHARYSGNPLALQIVAETIRELFAGEIGAFLRQDIILFGGIADLLAQQLARLSPLEQEIMFWLAVEREPAALGELCADIVPRPREQAVLAALHALLLRSLVEQVQNGFILQNVVLEYFTATLIERVSAELLDGSAEFIQRYALLKATAKGYVRDSQRNLILGPIARRMADDLGLPAVRNRLASLLDSLRCIGRQGQGYAAGNILNLVIHAGKWRR